MARHKALANEVSRRFECILGFVVHVEDNPLGITNRNGTVEFFCPVWYYIFHKPVTIFVLLQQ